jgi:hypothetical protein
MTVEAAKTTTKTSELHATIIRGDGTREELGLIAHHYTGKNPIRRLLYWWTRLMADHRIKKANQRAKSQMGGY